MLLFVTSGLTGTKFPPWDLSTSHLILDLRGTSFPANQKLPGPLFYHGMQLDANVRGMSCPGIAVAGAPGVTVHIHASQMNFDGCTCPAGSTLIVSDGSQPQCEFHGQHNLKTFGEIRYLGLAAIPAILCVFVYLWRLRGARQLSKIDSSSKAPPGMPKELETSQS